jgi:heptaprenyl diphosphate synthase
MFLSALDYLIPKPLPFMRIGLANLPILLALDVLSPANYCRLVLLKVLGQGFITGALFSYVFLFSLAGSVASAALMYGLRWGLGKKFVSFMGIGLAGAFVSNSVQLVLARFFVFGESALYLAPPFLAAGIVSGAALGLFAKTFTAQSHWFQNAGLCFASPGMPGRFAEAMPDKSPGPLGVPGLKQKFLFAFRFLGGLGAVVLFLLVPSLGIKVALFVLFWLLAAVAGKKTRPVSTFAVIGGVVFCNLFPPYGKVLVQAGPLSITLGSLIGGVRKAVTLEGLVMLSKLFVSSGFTLPGSFGRLLGESFRILEKLNERKGKITGGVVEIAGSAAAPGGGARAGKQVSGGPQSDPAAAKKNRFMETLDGLLLELTEGGASRPGSSGPS